MLLRTILSAMWVEVKGKSKKIGWVFQKTEKYMDTGEPYIQETWVSIHKGPETKSSPVYNYMELAN
jgi:hypothetical protein